MGDRFLILVNYHPIYEARIHRMIEYLIDHASKHAIQKVSLSVSKDNHALNLYRQQGFLEYADTGDALLMVRRTET